MSSDGEGFMEAYSSMAKSSGYTEETLNLSMTAKQPPSYDGKVSWFRYEELVHYSKADSQEMLTCTRQSSKMTFCKILMKESTISRTR